jgi:hypothetical protein
VLRDSFGHLDRFFDIYAPELLRGWWLVVAALLALTVVLLVSRRAMWWVPAATVLVVIALALANERGAGLFQKFIPYSRLLLPLPMAMWFLALLVAERRRADAPARLARTIAISAVVVAVAAVSVGLREADFDQRVQSVVDVGRAQARLGLYGVTTTADVLDDCDAMADAARQVDAGLALVLTEGPQAYACEAVHGDGLRTAAVSTDRRAWRFYDEQDRRHRAFVVFPAPPDFCGERVRAPLSCTRPDEAHDVAVVSAPEPASVAEVADELGVPLRPFGPDCDHIVLRGGRGYVCE